jgi:hypothetical protein
LSKEKESPSEHHGLDQGCIVVNPLGVVVPMVGWKQTPLSAIASHFPFYDKYLHTLCNEMEVMVECMCLWSSFIVFEQLLEMIICFYKLIYLHGILFASV